MAKTPDQYNSNAPVAKPDGSAAPFFVQQWNLLLSFVKESLASVADLVAGVAAALAAAQEAATAAAAAAAEAAAATAPTGVVAGSYTNTNLTVGEDGRLTAASNGGGGGGGASPYWAAAPTPPVTAGFTFVTNGTVAQNGLTRGVALVSTGVGASNVNQLMLKAAPGATWVLTALLVGNYADRQFMQRGVAVRDSATGRIETFGFCAVGTPPTNGAVPAFRDSLWSAISTFVSSVDNVKNFPQATSPLWMKMQCTSTNLVLSMSSDGENFTQLYSVAKNNYVANINQVGVFFGVNQSDTPQNVNESLLVMSFDLV